MWSVNAACFVVIKICFYTTKDLTDKKATNMSTLFVLPLRTPVKYVKFFLSWKPHTPCLVSLIYRLRVNALKTKYCEDFACTCRDFFFNRSLSLSPVKNYFRSSDLFPNSTIDTFPTDVHFVPLAHLLLESNWSTYLNCIWVDIYVMYVSLYMHFRVLVYHNCSRAVNYFIIIKHDYYIIKICLISS